MYLASAAVSAFHFVASVFDAMPRPEPSFFLKRNGTLSAGYGSVAVSRDAMVAQANGLNVEPKGWPYMTVRPRDNFPLSSAICLGCITSIYL